MVDVIREVFHTGDQSCLHVSNIAAHLMAHGHSADESVRAVEEAIDSGFLEACGERMGYRLREREAVAC